MKYITIYRTEEERKTKKKDKTKKYIRIYRREEERKTKQRNT